MNPIQTSIWSLLKRLWCALGAKRKIQFSILLQLMIISSFAEFLNIGAVLPLLSLLVAPDKFIELPQIQEFMRFFNIQSGSEFIAIALISFGFVVVFANAMRMIVVWANVRLSSSVGADLSIEVYKRTLHQPYIVHLSRNSSDVINVVTGQVNYAVLTIAMVMNLVGSVIMLAAMVIAIWLVDPRIATAALVGFSLIYLLVAGITRARLNNASRRISMESARVVKTLQEGLGGIRDVLIDGNQEVYSSIFHQADSRLRRARGNIEIMSFIPRFGVETLSLLFILSLAYYLMDSNGGLADAIPILGALAIGAQRMLPLAQLVYVSVTGIRGNKYSLIDTLNLLDQPLPQVVLDQGVNVSFDSKIILQNVSFKYPGGDKWVLNDINFSIRKGERVGIIGKTGGGKSTLLDLVMGLLEPSEGKIMIDGVVVTPKNIGGWQKHIAHVPQSIYLADCSIGENIAFGIPRNLIDFDRVRQCAEQAQISTIIESWPNGFETMVGERGVRLSGGQRQRIGIARALYKNADVIIFDEATSALDSETEASVINAIDNLSSGLTILMIAHRLTTLKGCSKIIELSNGLISRECSYEQIASGSWAG